ncbi:rod shape-determining protein MreC [Candidatus Gracilibacteria bacterium]|jgi:rod shape-determining protein MreC|nr:rod shape-determining protein MreC [Candidatus Gracilibacteria bacterium]
MKPIRPKYRSRYLIGISAILIIISLVWLLPQTKNVLSPVGSFLAPTQRFLYRVEIAMGTFWHYLTQDTDTELQSVKNENERLQAELSQMSLITRENEALRSELTVQRTHKRQVALAHVIGEKPGSFSRFLILDIGSNQGLRVGLPVILNNALVGKIEHVSEHSAEMSLVTDPKSVYYSYLDKSHAKGLVQGTIGLGLLHMTQVPKSTTFAKGEYIFTTGQELENFNDILIGTVSEVISSDQETYLTLLVTPTVESTQIDSVFVVLN